MMILMFFNIFIIVFLTNGKEINEFTKTDWIIFTVMSVIETATVISTLHFAKKTGVLNLPIEYQQYCIKRNIIETKPLLSGYIVSVYTDVDFMMRVTVFGYPHRNDVYAAVQLIEDDYNFVFNYNTATYDTLDELLDDFGDLIEITDKFLIK